MQCLLIQIVLKTGFKVIALTGVLFYIVHRAGLFLINLIILLAF